MFNRIVIMGLGGIGSHLAPIVCRIASNHPSSPKSVVFVDGDRYSVGNLDRQNASEVDIGKNKAEATMARLSRQFPKLTFSNVPEYFSGRNAEKLVTDESIVILGFDNYKSRLEVSLRCQEVPTVALISAGNDLMDGSVLFQLRAGKKNIHCPIEAFHPEIENPRDENPADVVHCDDEANAPAGGQTIVANLQAAVVAASYFLNLLNSIKEGGRDKFKIIPNEVYFDLAGHGMNKSRYPVSKLSVGK